MTPLKAAVYLILRRPDGTLFLIRRGRTPYYQGWFSLVAGHVEAGETPDVALCREAREEIGILLSPSDLTFLCVGARLHDSVDYHDFFFTADHWQGEPTSCEPEKVLEPGWRTLSAVQDQTVPYILQALAAVERGDRYFVSDQRTGAGG